jgi:hypothetical protein
MNTEKPSIYFTYGYLWLALTLRPPLDFFLPLSFLSVALDGFVLSFVSGLTGSKVGCG